MTSTLLPRPANHATVHPALLADRAITMRLRARRAGLEQRLNVLLRISSQSWLSPANQSSIGIAIGGLRAQMRELDKELA